MENKKRKNIDNEATLKKGKILTFGEKKELCNVINKLGSIYNYQL